MRTGTLYIDGNDAYRQFGVSVVKGGYDDIIAMPPLKKPQTNDWQEEDGIEADLTEPVLDAREISVKFAIAGMFNRYEEFVALLADGAYHIFNFAEIQRKYKLRLVSCPTKDDVRRLGVITLKLADDFPMFEYEYSEPETNIRPKDDYYIDNVDVAEYGVRILEGTRKEITAIPEVKKNLEIESDYTAGKTYDPNIVTFKSMDAKINCLIHAENLEQLWRNYDALLYNLIQPEERELYSKELEHTFFFYYKSCKVTSFSPKDSWLQFTLTLTLTGNIRLSADGDFVLAAENGDIIITEDGVYAIDMTPDRFSYPSVRLINDRKTLRFTGSGGFRFNN